MWGTLQKSGKSWINHDKEWGHRWEKVPAFYWFLSASNMYETRATHTHKKIIPTTSATSTSYIVGTRKIPSESLNQTRCYQWCCFYCWLDITVINECSGFSAFHLLTWRLSCVCFCSQKQHIHMFAFVGETELRSFHAESEWQSTDCCSNRQNKIGWFQF